jgi:hypothetical protein
MENATIINQTPEKIYGKPLYKYYGFYSITNLPNLPTLSCDSPLKLVT